MAHCMVLLVPFGRNRVTYLYCWVFGFQRTQRQIKNPLTYKPKSEGVCPAFFENFFIFLKFIQNTLLKPLSSSFLLYSQMTLICLTTLLFLVLSCLTINIVIFFLYHSQLCILQYIDL